MRLTCLNDAIFSRGPGTPRYWGFTITLRQTTLDRANLDELSDRRRDLYLNNCHRRQTSVPPADFEPAFPASEQPQSHTLDRAATRIGHENHTKYEHNLWANFRDLCGKVRWIIIIIFLRFIVQCDNVTTTQVYLISVFSFVISKDMDNLRNYLDTSRLPSRLTLNDKSVLFDMQIWAELLEFRKSLMCPFLTPSIENIRNPRSIANMCTIQCPKINSNVSSNT